MVHADATEGAGGQRVVRRVGVFPLLVLVVRRAVHPGNAAAQESKVTEKKRYDNVLFLNYNATKTYIFCYFQQDISQNNRSCKFKCGSR